MAQANGATVAGVPELEAFSSLPDEQRRLTDSLRGVLAETATTGRIRYKWSLLRPLVMFVVERVVLEYEEANAVEVGPSRPLPHDESVAAMLDRFRSYCWHFQDAPWTLQRLCELLLEPQKQYARLHKLALALEKLLLVTTEVPVHQHLPPPPLLAELGAVNENPPKVQQPGMQLAGSKRRREEDGLGMGMLGATFGVVPLPNHGASTQATADGAAASTSSSVGGSGGGMQQAEELAGTTQHAAMADGSSGQEQQQQQQQQQEHVGPVGVAPGVFDCPEAGASSTQELQLHQQQQEDQRPAASAAPATDSTAQAQQPLPAEHCNGVQEGAGTAGTPMLLSDTAADAAQPSSSMPMQIDDALCGMGHGDINMQDGPQGNGCSIATHGDGQTAAAKLSAAAEAVQSLPPEPSQLQQ